MVNIVLVRIDDRLIHGQVMTTWVKHTQGNRILIVDDEVVKDPFLIKVMQMATPSGVRAEILNTSDAITALKADIDKSDKVIVLAKSPKTILALLKGGVALKNINVGGMGACAGRKVLYKNISASEEEKEIFRDLIKEGLNISLQIVPDEKEVNIVKFI